MIEVFPLLGVTGIFCSILGFAAAQPIAIPALLLLLVVEVLQLLLLQHMAGCLKRLLQKRPAVALAAILLIVLTLVLFFANLGGDPRPAIRAAANQAVQYLPGSMLSQGLMVLLTGAAVRSLALVGSAVLITLVLLGATAIVFARELTTEVAISGQQRTEPPALGFRTPVVGLARLFCQQVTSTRFGLVMLCVPPTLGAAMAVLVWLTNSTDLRADSLPETIASGLARMQQLPLLELLMFIVVWIGAEIWMNQFGWDRQGLRTLLVLPLPMRQVLLGKLFGMAAITVLQILLASLPLLLVYRPSLVEIVSGAGGAGSVFLVMVAVGHMFSARFPRTIEKIGGTSMPIYLSWIPGIIMLVLCSVVATIQRSAGAALSWSPAVVLPLLLVASIIGYRRLLPSIARYVDSQKERLLWM
jgi:hypothetical protein